MTTRTPRPAKAPFWGSVLALIAAAGASWGVAQLTTGEIETRSRDAVMQAFARSGLDWASAEADGLQVALTGTAPSEIARFRALTEAAKAVDQNRLVDQMDLASTSAILAPEFTIELLSNAEGLSVFGLIPADTDRSALHEALTRVAGGKTVAEFLEQADYPVPDRWAAAVRFGISALRDLPRAKISITAQEVKITGLTDSRDARNRIAAALKERAPEGLRLSLDLAAPRPVMTPFTLRFIKDDKGARFDACAAGNEQGRDRILAAARAAGATSTDCTLALGAPSPDWATAAVAAINTVATLGAGSVTFSDADLALSAPASVPDAAFDAAVGKLQSTLPEVFSLRAERDPGQSSTTGTEFVAQTDHTGQTVSLRGAMPDERMRKAVEHFAAARFASVESALKINPDLPEGWPLRAIAAIEALDRTRDARAVVTPDLLRLSGESGQQNARDEAARVISARLGGGARFDLDLRYNPRLDPDSGLPDGAECVARLNQVMAETKIAFAPDSAEMTGDTAPAIAALADAMQDCEPFQIEIGGHTDSSGRAERNATLSQERAETVRAALIAAMGPRGAQAHLSAKGYGDRDPVADNDTEEGREQNRRTAFKLLSPDPVEDGGPAPPAPAAESPPESPQKSPPDPASDAVTAPDPADSTPSSPTP